MVEDEPATLSMAREILLSQGYQVVSADSPAEAIRLAQTHDGVIHLLLTDVVMPEMNGAELAARVRQHHPRVCQRFMSGYAASIVERQG